MDLYCVCAVCPVMSDSLQCYGLEPARLLCSWDFPGKNIAVGCHFLIAAYQVVHILSCGQNIWSSIIFRIEPYFILEKAMAPHSSTPAWKITWTEEPGRLQSMGLLRVRHNWVASLSLFTLMHWRRKWQPTPVFLPGESQGWGSLVGCHLWGCTESDMTDAT